MRTKLAISTLVACILLISGSVWASPNAPTILRQVIGSGGGQVSSGSISLEGTLGQSVTGFINQSGKELCSGFWCDTEVYGNKLYLPFVKR